MDKVFELFKRMLVMYTVAAPALLPLILVLLILGVKTFPLVLGALFAIGYNVARRRLLEVEVSRQDGGKERLLKG